MSDLRVLDRPGATGNLLEITLARLEIPYLVLKAQRVRRR
jgi:hypothetical protein